MTHWQIILTIFGSALLALSLSILLAVVFCTRRGQSALFFAVKDVYQFRHSFKQPHRIRPGIPHRDEIALQVKLIDEEYQELKKAIDDRDIIGVADGSADLIYVILHNCLAWGIDLAPIWDEVQRTNMAKLGGPKSPDGKQLKPAGWKPPDLRTLLRNQGNLHTYYYPFLQKG